MRCDEVCGLMRPEGPSASLSEERAGQVADHLDGCAECDRLLALRIGEALGGLPAPGAPSLGAVRELIRQESRQSFVLRLAGLAAAVLVVLATAWTLVRGGPPAGPAAPPPARAVPADEPIPDPPKLAQLKTTQRDLIRCESVLALYLQFCLTCLNSPNEQDRTEFLTRSLLIFREVRGRIRAEYERPGELPSVEAVTRTALNDALRLVSSTRLASVTLFPSTVTAFRFVGPDQWQVDHRLGNTPFRLTLTAIPGYLDFAYLKLALGANDALMSRIEEALWVDSYVALPKRILDRDPTLAPRALEAVLPLLSPRQQKIYRKIVGPV